MYILLIFYQYNCRDVSGFIVIFLKFFTFAWWFETLTNNNSVNVNFIILICKCSSVFLPGKQFITSIHAFSSFENILWECHTHTYIYQYIKAPVSLSYFSLGLPKAPPSWFPVIFSTHACSTDPICVAYASVWGHPLKHEQPSRAITSK